MISIEELREDLGGHLTDAQVENLRGALYALVENLLDDYIDSCANVKPTCQKQLSTAEFPLNDKRMKATV